MYMYLYSCTVVLIDHGPPMIQGSPWKSSYYFRMRKARARPFLESVRNEATQSSINDHYYYFSSPYHKVHMIPYTSDSWDVNRWRIRSSSVNDSRRRLKNRFAVLQDYYNDNGGFQTGGFKPTWTFHEDLRFSKPRDQVQQGSNPYCCNLSWRSILFYTYDLHRCGMS